MTDAYPDDSWDELTRELGVEKLPPPREREPEPEPAGHHDLETPLTEDELPEDGEFDGDLSDEAGADAPDGSEAQSGDEQPGTGRKRRRRRRRRKKGPGEGEIEPAMTEEADEAAPRLPRPPVSVPVRTARDESEFADGEYDSGEFDDEPAGVPLAAEEDTAGEVLRELIANWNVPSWDAIITGLNRPER